MLTPQDLTVDDFSGGITDFYIGAAKNRAQIQDNLLVLNNKKTRSRGGSIIDNNDPAQDAIPLGNERIGALINYHNSDYLFVQSLNYFFYRDPDTNDWVNLTGPVTANQVFDVGVSTNYVAWSEWNRHLLVTTDSFSKPQKIYVDGSGDVQVRTAGLPALASSPAIAAGGAGARSYIYAFHYFFEYTIGDQTFEDAGPVTQVTRGLSLEPSASNNAITAIPVLANGVTTNYDTATIKVYIFRTINNGTQLFKIGEVTNGTTVFTDNVSDATCATGEAIYTTGGVKDNNPPPTCRFVHTCNGFTYWAGLEDEPAKYRQSIQNDPDSVPESFEDEVDEDLQGFSSVSGTPIALCNNKVYRVDGKLDEFGNGFLDHVAISDDAGCISHWSIVQAEGKIFWAGNDGFYASDGFQVQKISFHLKNSYKEYRDFLSSTKKIQGIFNKDERRIYWTFQTKGSSTDVDACVILDLEWGISNECTFTTMSGTSFSPTAIAYFDKKMYRATEGYVFIHSEDYKTDPLIDINTDAQDWGHETIIWTYRGPAFNFGSDLIRKWVPRCSLEAKNESNISIQIKGIVDDGKKTKLCKEIRTRNNFVWGDPLFFWGDPTCKWGRVGIIDEWRRFPRQNLRCKLFQVEITNAFTIVANSDSLETATFETVGNTATLATRTWPTKSIGYHLYPEVITGIAPDTVSTYPKGYPVTARTDTVLTVIDAQATFPTGLKKWILKGYSKSEILHLLAYTIVWAPLSLSTPTWDGTATGENA